MVEGSAARARGVFPFVTADELDAATHLMAASPPATRPAAHSDPASEHSATASNETGPDTGAHDAARRLLRTAERLCTEPGFAAPLDGRMNLFVVQGLLLEASLAFRLTADERFVEPVRRVIASLADESYRRDRLPDEVHQGFVLVGLAVAAQLCADALDREGDDAIRRLVAAMGRDLAAAALHRPWGKRTPQHHAWNHSAVGFAGLGCAGLLCRGEPWADAWTSEAIARLSAFFSAGVTDAGMTREGLDYAGFVFRNAAPFLLACRNLGLYDYCDPSDNPHVERLRRVPSWYAMEVFPGGTWLQNINDAHWDPRRAMGGFLPMFTPLDPATVGWVHWSLLGAGGSGNQGQDSTLYSSALFESVLWAPGDRPRSATPPVLLADPDVGYLAERVPDGARRGLPPGGGLPPKSGFSLNCGRFFGGLHDLADNGSVTLFAGDVPLLIDSGAANDGAEGSASSSSGHNVMLVDGVGQGPAGRGKGVSATIVSADRGAVATVVTCDLAASYRTGDQSPVGHAVRHCVYAKAPFPYLLVVDDVARPDGAPATFDQLFHTPPATRLRLGGSELDLLVELAGESCGLSLHALDPCTVLEQSIGTRAEPWPQHPVWVLRRRGRGGAMATLALPRGEPGEPGEPGEARVTAQLDAAGGQVELHWSHGSAHGVDRLRFVPGAAEPARFTRDGAGLPDLVRLISGSPPEWAAVPQSRSSGWLKRISRRR